MKNFLLKKYAVSTIVFILFSSGFYFTATAENNPGICPYSWTKNLKLGSAGDEVLKLQQFLNYSADTMIATSGDGSAGKETGTYGNLTAKAVKKFQEKYASETLAPAGLTKGSGFVGALTRQKLNSLCVAPVMPKTVTTAETSSPTAEDSDGLTISSPEQPQTTLAPAGAGGITMVNITLTAGDKDVSVQSIVVERVGFGADGAFDSLTLVDEEGEAIGPDRSLNSNHKATMGEPFTITANTSKTLSVLGNMASDLSNFNGQMPALQITSINTSAKVTGTLPVRGPLFTVNSSLVIGGATVALSQFDPSTNITRYINDTNIRFSGIKLTANSREDLSLSYIKWHQTGTAGSGDYTNLVTVVNGVSYPTVTKGKFYATTFSPEIIIGKGRSVDVYLQGDFTTSGSNRNVKFDIDKSGDVSLTGILYGFGVLITPEGNTATSGNSVFTTSDGTTDGTESTPFFSGAQITISGGAFSSVGKN